MPNRILKESINESAGLAETSPFAQDLYKRLLTYADDYGRFNGDAVLMVARLFPRELDAVSQADVDDALVELCGAEKIRLYTTRASLSLTRGSVVFGYFPNWKEHQRLRESRSKCPDPEMEEINDWALRRFVSTALREEIFERDDFTCQECHASFRLPGVPPRRAMRLLGGTLHIDHEVPVQYGGRASAENLRLLCASCNHRRPRAPTLAELARLAAIHSDPPQPAANGAASPPTRAPGESNPIQSNPSSSTLATASSPKAAVPKPKREHVPITEQDVEDLVGKYTPRYGTPQAVRDEIELALNHQARFKNIRERLYVDGWLRRELTHRPTQLAGSRNGRANEPERRIIDRTGQAPE